VSSLRCDNLTEVFSRGAVVIEDRDNAGPEHLQGGYVGRQDTKRTSKCGHVDLFHAGLFEKHLRGKTQKQGIYRKPTFGVGRTAVNNQRLTTEAGAKPKEEKSITSVRLNIELLLVTSPFIFFSGQFYCCSFGNTFSLLYIEHQLTQTSQSCCALS